MTLDAKVGPIGTVATARGNFFDRKRVERAVSRAEGRVLSRFGAFVRQRAISMILRHPVKKGFGADSKITNRAGVSRPGEPPFAHLGLIPRFLFFGYERERHGVVIGPALLNGPRARRGALRILQEGGSQSFVGRDGRTRQAFYRPRPFMAPAFETELQRQMPWLFKDQVRE